MMSCTSFSRSLHIVTKTEQGDTQDSFELVYVLVMLPQWPTLSSLTESMNLENRNHQLLNHRQEHLWIHGRGHSSLGNLHPQKRRRFWILMPRMLHRVVCNSRSLFHHLPPSALIEHAGLKCGRCHKTPKRRFLLTQFFFLGLLHILMSSIGPIKMISWKNPFCLFLGTKILMDRVEEPLMRFHMSQRFKTAHHFHC